MENLFERAKRESDLIKQDEIKRRSDHLRDKLEKFFGPEIFDMVEIKGDVARINGSSSLYFSCLGCWNRIYLISDDFPIYERFPIDFSPKDDKRSNYGLLEEGFEYFDQLKKDRKPWWKKLLNGFNCGGYID